MNTKDKQEVASIVAQVLQQVLTAKKPETETKITKQEKKPVSKEHTKEDIPALIKKMSKQDIIDTFGDMTSNPKETPYKCNGITQFYKDNNIQLKNKYDRVTLTYENKHQVLTQLLEGTSAKKQTIIKKNCIEFLKNKIKTIPEVDRFGNTMTDKQRENITHNLQKEINRWNGE